ncbi:MAG: 30S ribosomal protein S12 methylthiotransferase RimO [Bacilli bacterium]|nr:30S ribosomal protein S12 methylthiotransferase RimO [Bacilli bacterium]
MKVGIVSLGCAKNLVDSEMILGAFKKANYQLTSNPKEADIIIVNTCGFIKDAQVESLNTILDMMQYRKKLIVTGCFAELYAKELKKDYPDIDLVVPFSRYPNFSKYVSSYLEDKKKYDLDFMNRQLITNANFAYLRIADGCNNFCSFCAIPNIRGRYRSRTIADIVKEANHLAKQGITEVTIIAQDVSNYGSDLRDGTNLTKLLKKLDNINGINHYRLLYLYPSEITDDFIKFMKTSKKFYHYFDIPLQHADEAILKLMNRKGSHANTVKILKKIRKEIPDAIFRTTFMVGFPGETNKSFKTLINFVNEFKFDHVGAFSYSREANTKAYSLPNQVNEKTKNERLGILMKAQKKISLTKNKSHIGETITGLYLGINDNTGYHQFLTKYNSPDDTDGSVFADTLANLEVGKYYELKVKDAFVYDLLVEIKKKDKYNT